MKLKPTNVFYRLSGADPHILNRDECQHDRAKYHTMGGAVVASSVLALASGTALAATIVPSGVVALLAGAGWATIISLLDRALILSINKSPNRSLLATILQIAPRLALGLFTSILVSKPLEMAIFRGEIDQKLVIMEQQKEQSLREDLIVEDPELSALQNQVNDLKQDISRLETQREQWFKEAIDEAEGTGGSGKPGKGALYEEKDAFTKQLDRELTEKRRQAEVLTQRINTLTTERNRSIAKVAAKSPNGLLARHHALEELKREDKAIDQLVNFLSLVILGLETAPIAIKLFSKPSVYDTIVASEEAGAKMFFTTEREIYQRQARADIEERLNNINTLTKLLHDEVAKQYPQILEGALRSTQFETAKTKLIAEVVSRYEELLQDLAKGSKPSYRKVKAVFNEVLEEFDESFLRQTAEQYVADAAIDTLAGEKPPTAEPMDDDL